MTQEHSVRRLAAILSADVASFSRLMHEDEEGTLAAFNAHRRELIAPKTAEYHGRIVKMTGDGMLLEFPSVVDAVRCAIAVQREMARRSADVPDHRKMFFRVGINLGDVIVEDDDIYGDGVNIAARLETLASPGTICISGPVYDQLAGKISQDVKYMGDQTLKNIEGPVRTYLILEGDGVRPTVGQPQTASDLGFGAPARPSIAILPFRTLSNNPGQTFLAEGLRLGILSSLVQLSGLFLVGTDAVDRYRNRDVSAAQAGAQVGVRYVLDGTVQQVGNRLRATLQVTDVSANQLVWSEHYDRDVDDVFKMQDEITQSVLVSLNVKLLGGESTRIWFDGITNPKAREHFHRGISHLYAGTKDDNVAALRQLHELHRMQPDTDHASSFISMIHLIDAMFGWSESETRSLEQAAKWAEIAIQYQENNGIGHVVMGYLKLLQGKHDEALENCELAIGLRPSCSLAHGILASVRNYCGDSLNAIKNVREALLLERIYPPWLINILATAYRDGGKVRLSIPAAKEALRLDSQQTEARVILCSDYNLENSRDDARKIAQEILAADPAFRLSTYALRQPYKYTEALNRVVDALRDAGLPE